MSAIARALRAEVRKLRASRVAAIAGSLLVVGVVGITSAMTLDIGAAPTLAGEKFAAFAVSDAPSFVAVATQIAAVASLLAFGVCAAWITGREFVDGTIAGLFARPTSRSTIAFAKLIVHVVWCAVVTVLVLTAMVVVMLALGYGWPGLETWGAIGRLGTALLITALLSSVASLVATLSRGYLAPIGVIIALVAASQVAVVLGAGDWFAFSSPTLWAMFGADGASIAGLVVAATTGLLLCAATVAAWRRLRLVAAA
ncbi:MAG: ABC transporter permease [Microcella sp.]|uniref:ABC transporter permease n=1 Tax=Microcella sp. TaxID=1913979 RepID=UPI0024C956EE|nr:ABC transporter permease [Microcella sp.]UYN82983.1 MAG: ABC transporter permease [Microcella sp.]